jgi:hypothetical protein
MRLAVRAPIKRLGQRVFSCHRFHFRWFLGWLNSMGDVVVPEFLAQASNRN